MSAYNKNSWTYLATGKAAMGPVGPASVQGSALNVSIDGTDPAPSIKVSQPITTVANQQYIMKANFLFNDGAYNCTLYGQPNNLNVAYYLVHYPSNSWQQMTLPFYGGSKMSLFVTCPDAAGGQVAYDNIQYYPNNGPVRGAG